MSSAYPTEQLIAASARLEEGNDVIPTAEIFQVGDNKESSPMILATTAVAADAEDVTKEQMPLGNHPNSDGRPQQSLKSGFVCTGKYLLLLGVISALVLSLVVGLSVALVLRETSKSSNDQPTTTSLRPSQSPTTSMPSPMPSSMPSQSPTTLRPTNTPSVAPVVSNKNLYYQVQANSSLFDRGGFSSHVFEWRSDSLTSVIQSSVSVPTAEIQEGQYFVPRYAGIWSMSACAHMVDLLSTGYFALAVNMANTGGTTWANGVNLRNFTAGLNTYYTNVNRVCISWTGSLRESDRVNFGGLLEGGSEFKAASGTTLHAALVGQAGNDFVQARASAFLQLISNRYIIAYDTAQFFPQSTGITASNFGYSASAFYPSKYGIWSVSCAIQSVGDFYSEVWMTINSQSASSNVDSSVPPDTFSSARTVALRRANSGNYHLTWTGYLMPSETVSCLLISPNSFLHNHQPYSGSGLFASFLTDDVVSIQARAATNLVHLGASVSYAIAWEKSYSPGTYLLSLSSNFDQETKTKFFPPESGIWSVQCVVTVSDATEFGVYLTINSQGENDQLLDPTPNMVGARTVMYEVGDGLKGAKTLHWNGFLDSSDFIYCGFTSSAAPTLIATSTSLAIARVSKADE